MNWIMKGTLAIGNHAEARDEALLRQLEIRSVLSLDGSLEESDARTLGLDRIESVPLIDGAGNSDMAFRRAIRAVGQLIDAHPAVLVQCHAGRSRSVVIVAGHLAAANGWPVDVAMAHVMAKRESAVSPELALHLQRVVDEGYQA